VITIFSIPKPFLGEMAVIQTNAARSWAAMHPQAQVILVGDETGVGAAARELGADHVSALERSPLGAPRLDSAFEQVDALARHRDRCFVNADIVLDRRLLAAAKQAHVFSSIFLVVGQSRDLDPDVLMSIDPEAARDAALERGTLRGPTAIDWFVFPAGLFDPMPPFSVGRAAFDNWMIWKARQLGPVIDATDAVVAIHQSHGYDHLAGGKDEAYYGAEAARNLELAGGTRHRYTLHDASHRMRADLSIHRNPGSILRARETARKIGWKLGVR
jgi:hypothetical protein